MKTNTPKGYVSVRDIMQVFNCSRETVYLWLKKHKEFKDPIKIGQRLYWEKPKIRTFYQRHKTVIGLRPIKSSSDRTINDQITDQHFRKSLLNRY